jgi:hypothetical protein
MVRILPSPDSTGKGKPATRDLVTEADVGFQGFGAAWVLKRWIPNQAQFQSESGKNRVRAYGIG